MLEEKTIKISVDGNQLQSFTELKLIESVNNHHSFGIVLNVEAGESPDVHSLETSQKWLGKPVVIEFGERMFLGIATHISLHREKGNHGALLLSGYSRTVLLESEPHLCSWTEKKLTDIVKSITEKAGLKAMIKPEYTAKIEYESQYNETHFDFILRLAKQYQEWCYYDGEQLVFGKPDKPSPVKLEYGKDLIDLDISIQALARSSQSFSFNSSSNETHTSKTPDAPKGLNNLGQQAFNSSMDMFKVPANNFTRMRVKNKSELDNYLKKKQQSETAASHYITAKSEAHQLSVGSIVDIHTAMHIEKKDFKAKSQGNYIITHIEHIAEEGGVYSNTFTALPDSISSLPPPNVPLPIAQTQMATVVSNKDPKKKGRVQVKMNWQAGDMKTSWLRVMTPDGGSSDKVGTNRGFVFIPEEGDQVLVGFRYNDPNRPFVMGSLFNGQTAAGGGDNNKTKSIITRSGSSITFDDDNEKGNITIKDGANNVITLNGNDTVSVVANGTISLATGESSITLKSDGTINIIGKNISISGSETTSMATSSSTFNTKSDTASVNATKVEITGTQTATMTGQSKATVSSSATTSVEGTIVKLN